MCRRELQAMTKCSDRQLDELMTWLWEERENLLLSMTKDTHLQANDYFVKKAHLEKYQGMVDHVERQMEVIQFDMEMADVGSRHHDTLLKQYLLLKKEWEKDTGVGDMMKTVGKIMEKQQIDAEDRRQETYDPNRGNGDTAKRLKSNSVFDVT